jgi:hypothetical protein
MLTAVTVALHGAVGDSVQYVVIPLVGALVVKTVALFNWNVHTPGCADTRQNEVTPLVALKAKAPPTSAKSATPERINLALRIIFVLF